MAAETGVLRFAIEFDDKGVAKVKNAKGEVVKFEKQSKTSTNKMGKQWGGLWKQMAGGQAVFALLRSGVRMVGRAISAAVGDAISFEKELANVSTLVDTSVVNMEKMGEGILDLAGELGSAEELTKGLYQALSAGVEPAKGIDFIADAAKFAKAGLTDMFTAVDAITTAINAYGLQVEQASHVSDVFFEVIKMGKITGEQLSSSIGLIISSAAQMDIGLTEVGAAIAAMTKVGIPAERTMTALNQTMMAVLKPSQEAADTAKQLGIEFTKAGIQGAGGFQKWLAKLKVAVGDNERLMAKLFPNVRALRAVFSLTGKAAGEYASILEGMTDVAENTNIAFEKQISTFEGVTDAIKNKLSAVITQSILPILQDMAKYIKENSDEIVEFAKGIIQFAIDVGKAIGKVIGFFLQFKDVIIAVGKAWLAYWAITKITAWGTAIVSGVGLAITAFGNLKILIIATIQTFVALRATGLGVFASLKTSMAGLMGGMGKLGKAAGVVGAAFIGWEIGKVINQIPMVRDAAQDFFGMFISEQKAVLNDRQKKMQEEIKILTNINKLHKLGKGNINEISIAIKQNIKLYSGLSISTKTFIDKLVKIRKENENINKPIKEQIALMKKAGTATLDNAKYIKLVNMRLDEIAIQDEKILKNALENAKKIVKVTKVAAEQTKKVKEIMIDLPEPIKNAATQIDLFGKNFKDLKRPIFETVEITEKWKLTNEDLIDGLYLLGDVISNLSGVIGDELADALANAADLMISIATMNIPGIIGGFMNMIADLGEAIFGASDEEMARRWADAERQQEEYIKKIQALTLSGINEFTKFLQGGVDDAESFNAAMNITLRNFAKLAQEGKSFSEIFDIMGEQFDILGTAMKDLGIEGNETFEKLMKWREFTKTNKVLFDSINALNNALVAMAKTGMVNTQDAFDDFQTLAIKNFDKLIKAGADENQALLAMLPSLRTLNELHEKHGYVIDENIQKQIDLAKEQGIFDQIDPMKEMVRLLGLLVEHFTGLAGSIADAAGQAQNLSNNINNMRAGDIGVGGFEGFNMPNIRSDYHGPGGQTQGGPVSNDNRNYNNRKITNYNTFEGTTWEEIKRDIKNNRDAILDDLGIGGT